MILPLTWGALSFPVDPDQPDQPTDPDDPGEPSQRTDPSIPDEPKLPQTGAGSRWSLAGILGAAGMILLLFGIFSKKKYHGKREAWPHPNMGRIALDRCAPLPPCLEHDE